MTTNAPTEAEHTTPVAWLQRPRRLMILVALGLSSVAWTAACEPAEDTPPQVPGVETTTTTTDPGAIEPGVIPGDELNDEEDRDDPTVPTPVP